MALSPSLNVRIVRLVYFVFDLLYLYGRDVQARELRERRALLDEVFMGFERDRVHPSQTLYADGPCLRVCSARLRPLKAFAVSAIIALALSACATGTIGPACGSKATDVVPGHSLRLVTFNTQLVSPMFQCHGPVIPTPGGVNVNADCYLLNPLGEYINERANLIADRLQSGQFDVIALNEVWDEDDGKDVLRDRLCPTYPSFVKYVDFSGVSVEEDSGLMLFSKFPLEPLPDDYFKSEDNESSGGNNYNRIAYVNFEDCEGDDCWAAKGAILVRLRHPSSNRIINVVGTHLQADYDGEPMHDGVRWNQIRQIRGQCETGIPPANFNLIQKTLSPSLNPAESLCKWSNQQWLLVMGDLNVQGQKAVGEALHPAGAPCKQAPQGCPQEWWHKIGDPAASASSTGFALFDSWGETTSEADVGITHEEDSQRLDYILVSRQTAPNPGGIPPSADLCVQHVWIPPEFEGLSDHRPVAADLNLAAPQCNPRLAHKPVSDDMGALGTNDKEAKNFQRELAHPGSMQWWLLAESGTYSVAINPDAVSQGVGFEIYQANDLSRPLEGSYALGTDTILACDYTKVPPNLVQSKCHEVESKKYVLPKGPYYVRVFSKDRGWTGDYSIAFHKYSCKTMADACELLPNAPVDFQFPLGTPINDEDAAWFRIEIREQADSGERQRIRFYAENAADAAWQEPLLVPLDSTGTTALSQVDGQPLSNLIPSTTQTGKAKISLEGKTRSNEVFFLRVRRVDTNDELHIKVGWQTDLILLGGSQVGSKPATLVCVDETNPEWGEDNIDLQVNIDGAGWQTRGNASFDCDHVAHPRNWNSKLGVIRFLESVPIRLVELDTGPDDESPTASPDNWSMEIDMSTGSVRQKLWWKWEGGHYKFQFNMGKWLVQ